MGKPAADNLTDAQHVLSELAKRQPVDVAHHMAFSPEVTWGWLGGDPGATLEPPVLLDQESLAGGMELRVHLDHDTTDRHDARAELDVLDRSSVSSPQRSRSRCRP
jgi:hypothetical protein